ncbi:phosphatase PAP2 family protein [Clostridium bowmanii]|uniref:phosphatase PAP2 family protein n=1 Tax=Clostridium bowmanii TaxID=132925 RepID=UPI001C0DDF4F|nr:phosphatase PAP2 family protein [Clostridium bowmanii]MBU3189957.1 phosphatase PAP2 family protein [Clostridium bowmanii]MCA1074609.1 phosphatase PAP2 family protein [Clostridium bowmanii]
MISIIQRFDCFILLYIKDNMHGTIMDKVMVVSSYLGDNGMIWIIISTILIISKRYRKIGFMALGALILSSILGEEIFKHVFRRIRPATLNLLIAKPVSYSFPSGHTTSSFAVAGVLAKYFKKYAFWFLGLAFFISFSRLYLYVHYPTDILAGIVLGLICSKIIIYSFNKSNANNSDNRASI